MHARNVCIQMLVLMCTHMHVHSCMLLSMYVSRSTASEHSATAFCLKYHVLDTFLLACKTLFRFLVTFWLFHNTRWLSPVQWTSWLFLVVGFSGWFCYAFPWVSSSLVPRVLLQAQSLELRLQEQRVHILNALKDNCQIRHLNLQVRVISRKSVRLSLLCNCCI